MAKVPEFLHKSTTRQGDDPREKPAAHLSFQLIYVNTGPRHPGADTGWRRLPAPHFELPTGGSWELGLRPGAGEPPQTHVVKPGEVAAVPSGALHRLRWLGPGSGGTAYLLGRYQWMQGMDLLRFAHLPAVLPASCGKRLAPLFGEMASLFGRSRRELSALAQLQQCAFRVLERVLEHAENPRFETPREPYLRMQPVLAHIHAHPTEPHRLGGLAQILGLSPTRFHALFKEVMGVAPKVYLRNLRCQRAAELLVQTESPVGEVAERCGFASVYYFSRLFHKAMGQPPTLFRAAFRKG